MSQSPAPSPTTSSWSGVEEAVRLICDGKGNLQTLGQLVRGLFNLGLGGMVESILGSINVPNPQWQAERSAIIAQAGTLSTGQLNWTDRQDIFSRNLASLAEVNPSLPDLKEFWREHRDRYSLFIANDGNFQVVDKQAPSIFTGFVGGLNDHRSLARFWTWKREGLQMPQPVAFDGAGYGWLFQRVLETTHRTFLNYSTAVYVIEPDLASACILLNLHDLLPWRGRLRFFIGPAAAREFQDQLQKNSHWLLPAFLYTERIIPRSPIDVQSILLTVAQSRQRHAQALAENIKTHYETKSLNDWASRYESAMNGGRPLKVLGITSRYTSVLQYSMDELGPAIGAAGHEFILCKEPDDQALQQPALQLMVEHKPDLIVLISRMRYENPLLPKNVPFLCWDQDNLPCMRTEAAKKSLDSFTYVAGAGARLGYEQLDWPKRNCILAFQAAATHRYHNAPVSLSLLQKHRCTFSYTSSASASPESLAATQRATYAANPRALALFDRAAGEILSLSNTGYAWDIVQTNKLLDSLITAESAAIWQPLRQEMILHLRLLSDRAFRHVTLGWVADYCRKNKLKLKLYGTGWESNPQFAEHAAGFLAPGEEMRAVFQASDINLQIIETGFLHSRALDGLAAGGFFLYRSAPEARDLDGTEKARTIMTRRAFETGCVTFGQLEASKDPLIVGPWAYARTVIPLGKPHERCRMLDIWEAAPSEETQLPPLNEITFADQQQFNAMADQFLADPDSRRDVARRLRQIIVDHFSYDARWRQFLSGITAGLQDAAQESAALRSPPFTDLEKIAA